MRELTNDGIYLCDVCDVTIKCFTSEGSTDFCPSCGAGSENLKDTEDYNE